MLEKFARTSRVDGVNSASCLPKLKAGFTLRRHRKEILFDKLDTIAAGAGVSVGYISQIERGLAAVAFHRIPALGKSYRLRSSDVLKAIDNQKKEWGKNGRNNR